MKDKCPNTPEGAQVDSLGCLPDFDKDGVPDNKDKCPNTLQGVAIDTVGCPLNKKENLDELKKGIQFKLNSAKLTTKSYGTLDDIARLMKKFPNANLEVQGHTDDKGTDEYNMQLSQKRAQAVMDYLITKGIDRSRLRAVGYGRTMPIASNNERNGREKNRRVEMVPFEK
jgi:outer membrane protein OmpA-like peptidoglycan-associated protein